MKIIKDFGETFFLIREMWLIRTKKICESSINRECVIFGLEKEFRKFD